MLGGILSLILYVLYLFVMFAIMGFIGFVTFIIGCGVGLVKGIFYSLEAYAETLFHEIGER